MRPESPKLLEDVRTAATFIIDKTHSHSLESYLADDVLRAAIERQFEIIGEALNQLTRLDPNVADQIHDLAKIIAFRNVLIHGYDAIDHRRVWDAVTHHVPRLLAQVEQLMRA